MPAHRAGEYYGAMRPVSRTLASLSIAGLCVGTLSACSAATPDPGPAADAAAAALQSADFSAVPLAGAEAVQAAESVEQAYRRMGQIQRTHEVAEVSEVGENDQGVKTASAVIHTVWDIDKSENDLAYDTNASFEYDDEAKQWRLRFDPALLAPQLSEDGYLAASSTAAERGDILGANGDKLVTARPVVRVGIDKTLADAGQWETSAKDLAELVGIDAESFAQRVAGAGERAWVQAIVLRDDADREVSDAQIAKIPGAAAHPDQMPLAPTRSFARPLLGTVGDATAEIIEKSEGKIRAGDQVGLSGLQATHQDTLAGTAGTTVIRYSAQGEAQQQLLETEPVPGEDLQLTLDADLQQLADQLVADADSPSALVAIRPSDGAVLAAASGPEDNGYNTALLGRYAPGSSFKVVSALAMLRDGASPGTEVSCSNTTTVDGKSFKNFDGYPAAALGQIPLSEALAQSCNTVFVNAGAQLGAPALSEAAAALGLTGQDVTGAGAFLGTVPEDSTGTELAANMIGQGVVQASPLGMATVAASVTAGHTVQPRLVLDGQEASAQSSPTASEPSGTLTDAEAKELAAMMGEVVDHGTLSLLGSVPGGKVIGKSGTAEYDDERNAHAWTIAAQGDLAVAAFVEDGQGGSQTAGPLVRDLLTKMER